MRRNTAQWFGSLPIPGSFAALAAIALLLICLPGRAAASNGLGQLTGSLFLDANVNGFRDPEDPGIEDHYVWATQGSFSQAAITDYEGAFRLELVPGTYTVAPDPDFFSPFFCVDSFGGFSPIRLDDCMAPRLLRPFTTEPEATVVVTSGAETVVDFGVRESDSQVLSGIAILQDDYPTPGTPIEAFFGDSLCGSSEAEAKVPGIHNYEMIIVGAGEQAGCPQPGDPVQLNVGGIAAGEPVEYEPTGAFFNVMHLLAITEHAWFWAQEIALPGIGVPGYEVVALVDGNVCAETAVGVMPTFSQQALGFTQLVVPPEDVLPGCGYEGATVEFLVGGQPTGTTLAWQRGIQYADLHLPGAVTNGDMNCSGAIESVDALFILRFVAELPIDTYCLPFARDPNCDQGTTSADALILLRFVASLPLTPILDCAPVGRSGP